MFERLRNLAKPAKVRRLPHRAWQSLRKLRMGYYRLPHQRALLLETDWNVIIVLDACRADYFLELEPDAQVVRSLGRRTHGWVWEFTRQILPRLGQKVLWITANPVVNVEIRDLRGCTDIALVNVWQDGWGTYGQYNKATVHPETVNERVSQYIEAHGQPGRMIVHYMQPHEPYIGEFSIPMGMWGYAPRELNVGAERVQEAGLRGGVQADRLRRAYEGNLRLVWGFAQELLRNLKGRIVVTADHAELLGEGNRFGHAEAYHHAELRMVPWLSVDNGPFGAEPVEQEDERGLERSVVRERLRQLGYM